MGRLWSFCPLSPCDHTCAVSKFKIEASGVKRDALKIEPATRDELATGSMRPDFQARVPDSRCDL